MNKVLEMAEETILIVDDDKQICETLSDIFSQKGINVITAYTGEEAFEKSKKYSPTIVLIDIKLPDIEGTQLFHELKKDNPELISIYITGFASLEHTLIAFKDEAEGFFVKPLPLEDLITLVEDLLEKKRLKEALKNSEGKYRKLSENLEIQVEKRTKELLETQEKLTRQERLGIFGQLMGGIAHEFNNILSAIAGATEIALENVKNDMSKQMLNIILKQSEKASIFIGQMLDFSRIGKIEPKIVELEAFFRETQEVFYVLFHENIIIDYKINPCKLKIDFNQLQQIMLNLLLNSRDAIPENGKVKISASIVKSNDIKDFELNKIRSGDYVHIQVADNGTGMSKEVLSKVFEPFYTTKPVGRGTGLGLSQVYGIVRLYRGYIYIESEKGKGTKTHLYFPVKPQ